MPLQTLPPLYAIPSTPKAFTYATPLSVTPKGSTLLRPWLSPLEGHPLVKQIRLAAQRPACRLRDTTYLNLQEYRSTVEHAVKTIAQPIPEVDRGHCEVSLNLNHVDDNLTVRCRVRPKTFTSARVKLLHTLDFTESRRIAAKLLLSFWSGQKDWLQESGIKQLEVRCDAMVMKDASHTSAAA